MSEIIQLGLRDIGFVFQYEIYNFENIIGEITTENGAMVELKLIIKGITTTMYKKMEEILSDIQIDENDLKSSYFVDCILDFQMENMQEKVYKDFEMSDYKEIFDLETVDGEKTLRFLKYYKMKSPFLHKNT